MSSSSTNSATRRTVVDRLFGRGPEASASGGAAEEKEGLPYEKSGPSFSPNSQASRSTLPEVIESLGTGLFQVRMSLLAGPVWFADGAELILISSVSNSVAEEWHFTAGEKGLVVSFVYLGVFVGNVLSGPFSDYCGRRLPILVSFLLIFFFSVLSAFSWGFLSLCFFRFLVGASMGIGQPAQQALQSEVTPSKWRIIFSSSNMYFFAFGEIYSGFLVLADDPQIIDVHWRALLIAGAIPSLVFGLLALAFLKQSPLFLACGGRYDETQEVLEAMRYDNGASDISIDFKPHRVICGGSAAQTQFSRMLRVIFSKDYLATTIVCVVSCFVFNLGYYGSLYAFPNVMSEGVNIGSSPAVGLIYGGLMEMVGLTVGVIAILYLPRILVMKLYMLALGLALGAFAFGAPRQHLGGFATFLTMFGYYGTKCFAVIGFILFYLYVSEVYPTSVRTTGIAVCVAGGRIAAMTSTLIYEGLTSATGHYSVFFWLMAICCLVNCLLTRLLTIETYGMAIAEEEDDCMEGSMEMESESPGYGSTKTGTAVESQA